MSDNNLFAEINPTEEATVSGGHYGYFPRYRRSSTAAAFANASASGPNAFTSTFSNATVDRHGNASATSSSVAIAGG